MGANQGSEYNLRVNLDKLSYFPGEVVNGTFSFDFGGNKNKRNNIKIKNPAVVLSIVQTETMQARTIPKIYQYTLFTQAVNITQLLDIKKNPDAIFTFQIPIPNNAQPNFEWPYQDWISCSLRSLIQVEIKDCKAQGSSFLVIKKNSKPLNSPLEIIEKTHKKGIFTGGDVLLKANYQTNSFPIYSQVPFSFTVDFSKSKYKIKGINYILKRKITMFDSHGGNLYESIEELMEKNIKGNMTKLQTENCLVELKDPEKIYKKYCMRLIAMANGIKPEQLITLLPSYKGSLFKCEYYIKLKAITDTPLISAINSPSIDLPIDVFSPIEYTINNISINPDLFPTMDQINSQNNPPQQYPPQQ